MSDRPLNHILEDNEGLAYECARLDRECKELRQQLEQAQAQARVADLEAESLQAVANKVCGEIPEDWAIKLCMENGSAWVEAETPGGDEVQFSDHGDMSMVEQVNDALCTAKGWMPTGLKRPQPPQEGE